MLFISWKYGHAFYENSPFWSLEREDQFYANWFIDVLIIQVRYLGFQFLSHGMDMDSSIQAGFPNRQISVSENWKCNVGLKIADFQDYYRVYFNWMSIILKIFWKIW